MHCIFIIMSMVLPRDLGFTNVLSDIFLDIYSETHLSKHLRLHPTGT